MPVSEPTLARSVETAQPIPRIPSTRTARWSWSTVLSVTTVLALGSAQIEGYLMEIHPAMAKIGPALFIVTWLASRLLTGRPVGLLHPLVLTVGVLAVVILVSAAVNLNEATGLYAVFRWLPFLVLTVALVDVLGHDVDPRVALSALMGGAVIAASGALFSFVVLDSPRATGPLEDPNDLAYVLTAAVPIVLIRLGSAKGWRVLGLLAALAVLLAGAAATVSRGGFLATLVAFGYVVARRLVPARLLLSGLAGLVALSTVVVLIAYEQVVTALNQKSYIAATNIETRTLRWKAALRMLGDNPVFGVGPGNQRTYYVEYSGFAELAELTPVTHQMYFEVGAELGVLGLALFLGLILGAIAAAEMAIRRLRPIGNRQSERAASLRLSSYSVQASLLALCTSSFFLSEEYYMPLWAGIAIAVAVEYRTRDPESVLR